MRSFVRTVLIPASFLMAIAGIGAAAPITVNCSNPGPGTSCLGLDGSVQVTTTAIQFGNYPLGTTFYAPPSMLGTFQVNTLHTGVFTSVTNSTGNIRSIQAGENLSGGVLFLSFTSDPTVQVYVTSLPIQALPTCDAFSANQTLCNAAPGSPITLSDSTNGAVATLNVTGYYLNTLTGARQDLIGLLSDTFVGASVANLEQQFGTQGFIRAPFSGTFASTAVVPEPATAFLGVSGLLLVAGLYRRRRRS